MSAPLRVFAAGSLRAAFDSLAEHWPGGIDLRYANAGVLAEALVAGERADVFASASPYEPARLAGLGLALRGVPFAANHLVVAVPPDSNIDDASALAARGVRLVIEVTGIPLGDYTTELLARLDAIYGGAFAERVLGNVVARADNVEAVAARVYAGDADVAILYATDVANSGGRLRAIEPPAAAAVSATYVVCAMRAATQSCGAREWMDLTLGPLGQRLLREVGFEPLPA